MLICEPMNGSTIPVIVKRGLMMVLRMLVAWELKKERAGIIRPTLPVWRGEPKKSEKISRRLQALDSNGFASVLFPHRPCHLLDHGRRVLAEVGLLEHAGVGVPDQAGDDQTVHLLAVNGVRGESVPRAVGDDTI
jgi:hypothetical protein